MGQEAYSTLANADLFIISAQDVRYKIPTILQTVFLSVNAENPKHTVICAFLTMFFHAFLDFDVTYCRTYYLWQ